MIKQDKTCLVGALKGKGLPSDTSCSTYRMGLVRFDNSYSIHFLVSNFYCKEKISDRKYPSDGC